MSSKTKVSKQVKVTQGKEHITFELTKRGLAIDITGGDESAFVLKPAGIDALRELLGLQQPLQQPSKSVVSLEEAAKRFTREGDAPPDRPAEEAPIEGSGLTRGADKTESGMD